ncbi:TetR/AcrR family transcriptional regulator [Pseudahrensia aquimaris]|uniref:TetR/AcrR family transcriptional regulator n=1 Tax=Pseudahrensia aquimaris TaxID=744461 RepID=A0ABW3FCB0_9HYPH
MTSADDISPTTQLKKPRGRPRKSCKEDLLDSAMQVFWLKGYEATSMSDLTDAMNMSRPSFYNTFASKEALFLQVLDRYGETIGMEPLRAMQGKEDIREAVEAFLRTSLENNTKPGAPTGCLYACAAATSAGVVDGVRERIAAVLAGGKSGLIAQLQGIPNAAAKAQLAIDFMNAQALRARAGETRQSLLATLPDRVEAVMSNLAR